MTPKPPAVKTLQRYGLTPETWLAIAAAQGNACPVCLRTDVELVTDHEHVKGFTRLPPEERRKYAPLQPAADPAAGDGRDRPAGRRLPPRLRGAPSA